MRIICSHDEATDLYAENDKLLKTRTTSDMLAV